MNSFKEYIHHAKGLEEAILGICLLEKLAFGRTCGLIDTETFYYDNHKKVYQTMKEMNDNSIPIDIYTVQEKLKGDISFLTNLTLKVVSSSHLEYHCHLIKEMWRRRRIVEIKFAQLEDDTDPRKNIHDINREINQVLGTDIKHEWYSMDQLIFDLMRHQYEMSKGEKSFITTGFPTADRMNGGFYNGQMIVLGARPSVGKSSIMGQMALKMAKAGKKVGIISLEMNNTEIAARMSAIETGIDFGAIYRTIATDEQLHRKFYDSVSTGLINLPIYISDKTEVNVNEIKAKAIKLKVSKGCDCIMVDYLQLIDGSTTNKNYNREQEVSKMSRGLKLMAQELDIPVIVLCQLNRNVTSRGYKDRFPKLSDLRESGAIEQDADVVLFIHRDYMSGFEVDEQGNSTLYTADLLASKWRNGATFHLPLDFDPPRMMFKERSGLTPLSQIVPKQEYQEFQDNEPF